MVQACVKTHEELAQVGTALDEIKRHLRVVEAVVASQPGNELRDASVKLLAQVVSMLAAIVKMTREGRLRERRVLPLLRSSSMTADRRTVAAEPRRRAASVFCPPGPRPARDPAP